MADLVNSIDPRSTRACRYPGCGFVAQPACMITAHVRFAHHRPGTGHGRFICQWAGCVKPYPTWPKLAQHLAKHVNTTQIICVQCGDANELGRLFRREQAHRNHFTRNGVLGHSPVIDFARNDILVNNNILTNVQLYTNAPNTVVAQRIAWLQNFLNAHATSADAAAAAAAPAVAPAGPANPRPPPPQQQRDEGGAGSGYTSSTDSTVTPSPVPSADAYSPSPSSEGTPGSGASDTAELQAVAHVLSLEAQPQQADDGDTDDPDDDGGDVGVPLPHDAVDQLDPLAYLMYVDVAALEALTDNGRPATAPPSVFDSWSILGVSARPAAQGEESAASASVASPAPQPAGPAASPTAPVVPWSRQANPNAVLIDAAVAQTDDDDRDGRTYRGPRAMPPAAAASPAASTPTAPAPWSSSPSPHGTRRTRDLSSTDALTSPAASRSASASPFQTRDLVNSLPSTRPQVGLTTAEACTAIRTLLARLESLKIEGAAKP